MSPAAAESLAVALLVATLAFAVLRPRGLPEAVVAIPAALLLLLVRALPLGEAAAEVRSLSPTIGFLAAVLLLAALCDRYGLFEAAGSWTASLSGGRPVGLLALVFVIASTITAVLSLDATVVLLTPVVLTTVARLRLRVKPYAYACTHLANSASLLLPVSNLTNLLAFQASGLSFARFGATMALPWAAAVGVEWVVLRRFFREDLIQRGQPSAIAARPWPAYASAIVALTLAGFFLTSVANVDPAFAAVGGAAALALPALAQRRASLGDLVRAVDVPFLAFVFALGIIVRALSLHGLSSLIVHVMPGGSSLPALLLTAAMAAVLANAINNLPAVLLLLPAAAAAGPGEVLAVLIGVNTGPNLTYVGSLATLLWRRVLDQRGEKLSAMEFLRLGAIAVPLVLVAATLALWISLKLAG